jgi:phosphohistidine phosphatase
LETEGITSDAERPLSPKGQQQAEHLGKSFRARKIVPDWIVASPLVRAQQTATILRETLELPADRLLTRDQLSPGSRIRKLARFLNGLADGSVALVGHEPEISRACGWLIGFKTVHLTFKKAAVAMVQTEGVIRKGCGQLIWLVTPLWSAPE